MVSESSQRLLLGVLIMVTAAAVIRVGLMPVKTAKATPIDPVLINTLESRGWIRSREIKEGEDHELSNAIGYQYQGPPESGLINSTLTLIPVRARGFRYLGSDTIGEKLVAESPVKGAIMMVSGDELYRISSKGDNGSRVMATCIAFGKARATMFSLSEVIEQQPISPRDRLRAALGLQPPRDWSCLYARLMVKAKSNSDQVARRVWMSVAPVLKGTPAPKDQPLGRPRHPIPPAKPAT